MKAGIDLGTTFSLSASLQNNGNPKLVPDKAFGDIYSTPSSIYLSDKSSVVGYMVDTLLEEKPELPVNRFFKRHFGEPDPIFFDSQNRGWLAESFGALILKKLKIDFEHFHGSPISGSVITIPAHFNDSQRKAVKNAAVMADLPLLGLVEEPVAAALHYGIKSGGKDKLILVYDLGGGTFDATILTMNESGVYVLAKDGIINIGGKEFDEALAVILLDQYKRNFGSDLELNSINSLQLRRISEELKIELSQPNKPFLKKMILLGDKAFEIFINKRDFDIAIKSMIEKTIEVTFRCLDGAGLSEKDIDSLMLVGGSSMIPYVKERLKTIFDLNNSNIFYHEPMHSVAYGAALHAAQKSGEADIYDIPSDFRGVTGHNIGIKTINPRTGETEIDCLIKKNIPLPSKATRTYYTSSNNQSIIRLNVVEYIDNEIKDLGDLIVGPINNPQINYPIEVTVIYNEDGTVKIEAFDPYSGVELEKEFGNDKKDTNSMIQQMKMVKEIEINSL